VTITVAIKKGGRLAGLRILAITEELKEPMWKIAIGGDLTRMCLRISTQKVHLRSDLGHHLAQLSEKVFHYGVGVTIIDEGDPDTVRLSLRSVCGVNVAEIVIGYGGGGHPGAAGMAINQAEFRSQWLKGQVVKSPDSDSLVPFS